MVKKRGVVWNYFTKKVDGTQTTAFCKFCDQSYIQNATRMEKHIERCVKCPENIRREFMKLVINKRAKSMISMKLAENWYSHLPMLQNEPSDENFESSRDWSYGDEYHHSILDITTSNNDNEDKKNKWHETLELHSVQPEETMVNREWNQVDNPNDIEQNETGENDEEADESNNSEPNRHNTRNFQSPLLYLQTSNSDLEKQILHEQYLERRAARKAAELDLQRRMLEFEKLQQQYSIDKTQNEMRWAHECRMMQLKEQQLQQLIKQNRDSTTD